LPLQFSFTSADNTNLEMSGWSGPEPNGTWSDGGWASIRIPLDPMPAGGVRVKLSGSVFVNERLSTQKIILKSDGQEIDFWTTKFPGARFSREFIIQNEDLHKHGFLIIDFVFPNAMSPAQLGLSRDPRRLGVALNALQAESM
jgi:hypothetical protein